MFRGKDAKRPLKCLQQLMQTFGTGLRDLLVSKNPCACGSLRNDAGPQYSMSTLARSGRLGHMPKKQAQTWQIAPA